MSKAHATSSEIVQRTKETLVTDLNAIVGDADTLLKDMTRLTADEVAVARQSIQAKLADARARIDDARIVFTRKACGAADATNEYISENPWKAVGVASLVGLVTALLLMRRSCR